MKIMVQYRGLWIRMLKKDAVGVANVRKDQEQYNHKELWYIYEMEP